MLDEMGKSIDAVTVSTPDHTHAPAALMAMRLGKHCFCQKPLTHSIYEARLMGQGRPGEEGRHADGQPGHGRVRACARRPPLIKAGALGKVKRSPRLDQPAHLAAGRRRGPKPRARARSSLNWDLWLGPATERPYGTGLPSVRLARLVGFRHRGAGRHGLPHDQHGLHGRAGPARSDLGRGRRPPATTRTAIPKWSIITYEFAADGQAGRPSRWSGTTAASCRRRNCSTASKPSDSGCVVIGEKGKLFSPNDYGAAFSCSAAPRTSKVEFEQVARPLRGMGPRDQGRQAGHVQLPRLRRPADRNDPAGQPGRLGDGEKVEWDAKNMKSTNVAGLEEIIKPVYRKGYTLDV